MQRNYSRNLIVSVYRIYYRRVDEVHCICAFLWRFSIEIRFRWRVTGFAWRAYAKFHVQVHLMFLLNERANQVERCMAAFCCIGTDIWVIFNRFRMTRIRFCESGTERKALELARYAVLICNEKFSIIELFGSFVESMYAHGVYVCIGPKAWRLLETKREGGKTRACFNLPHVVVLLTFSAFGIRAWERFNWSLNTIANR